MAMKLSPTLRDALARDDTVGAHSRRKEGRIETARTARLRALLLCRRAVQ
jgi:hypothetical protein